MKVKNLKKSKGISMIALVITIVVMIILAIAVLGNTESIDQAGEVKVMQELSEVKKGVNTVRIMNAKGGTDEKTLNKGFIKVNVENAPESFVSFDSDSITGYVVDLNTIEYEKIENGHGYLDIVKGDTVTFDESDVYIYDAAGNVYYACGYVLESGNTSYTTDANESDAIDGPKIEIVDTTKGHITIKVSPAYDGTIKSVTVGGQKATSTDGTTFTIDVATNGTYIVIAEEENAGSTRTSLKVSDIEDAVAGDAVITAVTINDGEEYTKKSLATLKVTGTNCTYIAVIKGSSTAPNVSDSSNWRKYTSNVSITLQEGLNQFYVWGKNSNDKLSSTYKLASITLDQTAPTRTAPTYTLSERTITINCNQTDASTLTVQYGYKRTTDSEFTWQNTNTVNDITPSAKYVLVTKATDAAGNTSTSRETTTEATQALGGGVVITPNTTNWAEEVEVTITYPENIYSNAYRLNEGEWKIISTNQTTLKIVQNTLIEAAICADNADKDFEAGEIAKLEVDWIDRTKPNIYDIDTGSGDPVKAGYEITANVRDDESGLVAWTITTSETEPSTWENEFTSTNSEVEIAKQIDANGTYYIWAKDEVGHVSNASFSIQNIDKTDPVIENYTLTYGKSNATMSVTAYDRTLGLVAYAVVKGKNTQVLASDWIKIDTTTADYAINYTVTENNTYTIWVKDASGRTASLEKEIKVKYEVTFDYEKNGGTSLSIANNKVEYGCNETVDLSPVATKSNFVFKGWNTDANASSGLESFTIGTENVTLYAIFTKRTKSNTKILRRNVTSN